MAAWGWFSHLPPAVGLTAFGVARERLCHMRRGLPTLAEGGYGDPGLPHIGRGLGLEHFAFWHRGPFSLAEERRSMQKTGSAGILAGCTEDLPVHVALCNIAIFALASCQDPDH